MSVATVIFFIILVLCSLYRTFWFMLLPFMVTWVTISHLETPSLSLIYQRYSYFYTVYISVSIKTVSKKISPYCKSEANNIKIQWKELPIIFPLHSLIFLCALFFILLPLGVVIWAFDHWKSYYPSMQLTCFIIHFLVSTFL